MTPEPATSTVFRDDVVNVPTKSTFKSTAIYGLAIMVIDAAIAKWVKPAFQDAGHAAALEVLDYLIPWLFTLGAAMVAWGRAHAAQPLHLFTPTSKAVEFKSLAPFLLAVPLLCGGCNGLFRTTSGEPMSMASRLLLAKQTHTTLKNTTTNLIDAGVINDQPTKDTIWAASEEIRKALEEADARVDAGDTIGFNDVMARAAAALDRLAQLNGKARASAQPRSDAWTPRRSSPSFLEPLPSWESSKRRTTAPPSVSRRPTPTVARWMPQRQRHALA